jgi:hypothetical protein
LSARPQVDPEIDSALAELLSPKQHQDFYDAEAADLSGLTPREAVAAGRRDAVLALIDQAGAGAGPFISREDAQEIFRVNQMRREMARFRGRPG